MTTAPDTRPLAVIERLLEALNRHDLDAFVACFASDYRSEQPLHPDRAFQGRDQVRQNWAAVFAGMPDVQWDLLRSAVSGDVVWIEVSGRGTRLSDGAHVALGGVLINQVQNEHIVSARIYFDEIAAAGAGIDSSIDELYRRVSLDDGLRSTAND